MNVKLCFSYINDAVLVLFGRNLHRKNRELSIKTRSTPASLSFTGQATKHTTVKGSIQNFGNTTRPVIVTSHA